MIRLAVPDDVQQMADIWNQNVVPTRAYFPGAVDTWTADDALRFIAMPSRFGVWVSDVGAGVLDGFCYVQKDTPTEDQIVTVTLRLDDLTGTAAQKIKKWGSQMVTSGHDLVRAWLLDAQARGVTLCWGDLPTASPAGIKLLFDKMQITTGTVRADYKRYSATPADGILGIAKV